MFSSSLTKAFLFQHKMIVLVDGTYTPYEKTQVYAPSDEYVFYGFSISLRVRCLVLIKEAVIQGQIFVHFLKFILSQCTVYFLSHEHEHFNLYTG